MKRSKIKIKYLLLYMYLISLFFTTSRFVIMDFGGVTLQFHHLIFVLFFVAFLGKKKGNLKRLPLYLPAFFVYLVICSLLNSIRFGLAGLFVNAVYAFALICVIYNLFNSGELAHVEKVFGNVAKIMYFIIFLNVVLQLPQIISFFAHPYGHPSIKLLVGGGHGVESTLISMFSIFLLKEKKAPIFCCLNLVLSILYASRTGMLMAMVVFLYYGIVIKKMNLANFFKIVSIAVIGLLIFLNMDAGQYLLNRFQNIGVEVGSATRLDIWSGAFSVFETNVLGVGCGNVIKAINVYFGGSFGESNSHNIYLQYIVDEGIVGLIFIVTCLYNCIRYNFNHRLKSAFAFYLLLYLFQGLFQSRGVDAWMAVVFGFYMIEKRGVKYEKNNCLSC